MLFLVNYILVRIKLPCSLQMHDFFWNVCRNESLWLYIKMRNHFEPCRDDFTRKKIIELPQFGVLYIGFPRSPQMFIRIFYVMANFCLPACSHISYSFIFHLQYFGHKYFQFITCKSKTLTKI